jgi:ketosteroid isomerase-like protein
MYLKYCAVVCVLLIASMQSSFAQQNSVDIQELTRLEKVWNEAYVRSDADALDRLCAEDLVVTMTDMQVLNKQKAIGIVRSGKVEFRRYETSELSIHMYDNAAVVTGRLQRTRIAQGREVNDEWRFTKVYVRSAKGWQVVAWHASTTAT